MSAAIRARKADHLRLCATAEVGFRARTTLLEQVRLVHDALPELATHEVDLSTSLFGKRLRAPLLIAAMTGGTSEARDVNRALARIAERRGYGMALGSQRAMLDDPSLAATYDVRDVAPTAPLLGNLGVVQARDRATPAVRAMAAAIGADALCVHLNAAQELAQGDGDRDFRGGVETLARLARELDVPVVAKETGCGLARRAARKLGAAGVRHVDVSGAGGTSWVGVEALRAEDPAARATGSAFWDWGVPTAASVALVAPLGFETVIATGGIATGLDAAAAIALGATCVGIARPVLKALHAGGPAAAEALLEGVERDLRVAMVLTGSRTLDELRRAPRVLGEELARWIAGG